MNKERKKERKRKKKEKQKKKEKERQKERQEERQKENESDIAFWRPALSLSSPLFKLRPKSPFLRNSCDQ